MNKLTYVNRKSKIFHCPSTERTPDLIENKILHSVKRSQSQSYNEQIRKYMLYSFINAHQSFQRFAN